MSWHIFPTINNVGTIGGKETSILAYEPNLITWAKNLKKSPLDSFVFSGMGLSSPASNQVRVATGYAIIDGFECYNDANVDLTGLSNSTTYYIYATINYDGNGYATSITVDKTTSTSIPAASVLIGRAVVGGGGSVTTKDSAKSPNNYNSSYTGDGVGAINVFIGFPARALVLTTRDGTAANQVSSVVPGTTSSVYGFIYYGATPFTGQSAADDRRPDLGPVGFNVDGALNQSGRVYDFTAWA